MQGHGRILALGLAVLGMAIAPVFVGGAAMAAPNGYPQISVVGRQGNEREVGPEEAALQESLSAGQNYAVAGEEFLVGKSPAGASQEEVSVSEEASGDPIEDQIQAALEPGQFYAVSGDEFYVLPETAEDLESDRSVTVAPEARLRVADSAEVQAAAATPPWKKCGVKDSKHKLAREYKRQKMAGYTGASAHLRCGTENWSYKHIKKRHLGDWEKKAVMIGTTWQDFAHWSMTQSLSHPCARDYRSSNDTLQYLANVEIKSNKGKVIDSFGSFVSVARKTQNIITAYPPKKGC
ncbi:hypothetical protein Kisp01_67570 [Kineosporia sp. NBRC 101677]|nr:hypothetical protein Kisp01_67570 [Kineosporia sp. NBRC 101677]